MSEHLCDEIERFLQSLRDAQTELLELFGQKRSALISAGTRELQNLADQEANLARRLQSLATWRARLLKQAEQDGRTYESLLQVVRRSAGPQRERLEREIEQSQRRSAELRRESWIHWVITNRCTNHFTEVLELIAHCGEKPPTYGERPQAATTGGALLDASV